MTEWSHYVLHPVVLQISLGACCETGATGWGWTMGGQVGPLSPHVPQNFSIENTLCFKYTCEESVCVCVSHLVISSSFRPHGLKLSRILFPWDFPGKNTGMGCHSFLQGIFLTQGLNPHLLHCRQILYQLSHRGRVCCHREDVNRPGHELEYSSLEPGWDKTRWEILWPLWHVSSTGTGPPVSIIYRVSASWIQNSR